MKYLYAIALLFVVIISCSKDDGQLEKDSKDQITNDSSNNDTTTIVAIDVISDAEFATKNFGTTKTSNFIGKLTDINAQPLEEVKITLGNQTILTDANGVFILNEVTVNEKFAFIKAEKDTYILGSRSIVPAANGSNVIAITLLKKNSLKIVNSGEASEVSLPNGAKVNFGGSFINAAGASYSGKVGVSMHYLEPNQTTTFSQMPGSLFGKRENNEASAMETYGMLAINLYSPTGEVLNIAEDTPAELHFPISTTTPNAPPTIPLWYFDEAVGYWKEQGIATIVDGAYVAEVSHFTWWNCDLPLSSVNVCFELKKETALPNSRFEIRRTSNNQLVYAGYTNEQGLNCGLFPKNETLTLNLFGDCDTGNVAASQEIGPYSNDSPTIIINIDELSDVAVTSLTAIIKNCSNLPLSNGYAFLRSTNMINHTITLSIINGEIEQQFVYCKEGEYRMFVTDSDTNEVSDEIIITAIKNGVTNLGQLQTCPNQKNGEVFEGSITLTTQEEVDAFGLIGYTEITGDIRLDGQQSIVSLTSLSDLKTVGGEFFMSTSVYSLTGLENLTTIGNGFSMLNNSNLTTLIALESLTSVGGLLWIDINKNLTTLTGLESLTSAGSIIINSNEKLTTLSGLENLTSIDEELYITNHQNLTNIEGLNNLTSIGVDLYMQDNNSLTTIAGLENLISIGRNLKINGNDKLTALTGLENLTGVGQVFIGNSFRPNNALVDFCALTKLFTAGSHGLVEISNNKYNPSVNDINNGNCKETGQSGGVYDGSITLTTQTEVDDFGLLGYFEVTGDLIIEAGTSLNISSLASLENLKKIGGSLRIEETELTNLQGLDNLTFIGNRLTIKTNSNLTVLSGLDNLNTIEGQYVRISDNSELSSLTGLENVTVINGELSISYNHSLTSLIGLENITSIDLALILHQNHGLTSLQGLDNLTSIGNGLKLWGSIYETVGLQITSNLALLTINGLENLTALKGDLVISNNNNLPNLEGLENITAINGHLNIRKNAKLNSLKGLNNLTSILYNLSTSSSFEIDSLSDLENLSSIGNNLLLQETGITSLNGLEKLNSVGGKIVIGNLYDEAFNVISYANYSLSDFCALTNLITNGSYNEVFIDGNAYNPTTSDIYYGNCAE